MIAIYLAHDDPTFRHSVTIDEISPVFPGAEASYAVLMRYGKERPLAQHFKVPVFKGQSPFFFGADKPEERRKSLTAVRPVIEAHWVALTAERAWWGELAAFDRIGDLMPARFDAEIMSFTVVRAVSQHGVAVASIQAMDGYGDDAIDTLLPILGVGRKLQPYSRSLVRSMIGITIEKMSLNIADFILDTTPVSPAAKARLLAALKGGDPEAGARHLFATEYAVQFGSMSSERAGDLLPAPTTDFRNVHRLTRSGPNFLSPLIYNPHATFNPVGDLYADWQDLAAKREVDLLDARWKTTTIKPQASA
jgi:hypothetical protein